MKDPHFGKNKAARVSFTYRATALQGQHSLDKNQESLSKKIPTISLRSRPHSKTEINNPQFPNHQDVQVNTLKKQSFEVDALSTTRKPVTFKTETDDVHLDCSRQHNYELTLLKEEIRFMRRKLVEAENSEKDLRLEFELFRANIQSNQSKEQQKQKEDKSVSIEEIHALPEQENKLLIENKELKQKIKSQQQKILDLQSRVIQMNKSLIKEEGSADRNKQIQQLKNYLADKDGQIQSLKTKLSSLEQSYTKSQTTYANQLKVLECQKQKLEHYLEEQQRSRVELTANLNYTQKQNMNMQVKIEDLSSQIQHRMRDIDFLNQQSYNLDHSLGSAVKEIEELKVILQEKEEKEHKNEEEMETLRDRTNCFQQKVYALEGEIQRLAVCIYEFRTKHENALLHINQDKNLAEEVLLKCEHLEQTKEELQSKQHEQNSRNIQRISHLQGQLARLRGQNTHLRSIADKAEDNQRVLLNELQWIKRQKDEQTNTLQFNHKQHQKSYQKQIQILKKENETNRQREVQEIKILQARMKEMTDKFSESTQRYEDNLNSVIRNYEHQLKRERSRSQPSQDLENSSNSLEQTVSGHTLSKKELSKVLQQLKNQSQLPQQQNLKLREEVETLQQQMQVLKKNYESEIKQMKNRYELEIHQNNQQYSQQLNLYTQEIEKLMTEMSELKGQYNADKNGKNQVVAIQEEEGEDEDFDVDERKIKRDLLMHGQDPADFYVSPPSNTPIKGVSDLSDSKQKECNNSNYYLQDIIDLQTKIHSYIKNFNKKRSKDDHES